MNPYEILGLPPGADNGAVVRAMAMALREGRHDAATLAGAQRALLTTDGRRLADFCLPALPTPKPLLRRSEHPEPEPFAPPRLARFEALAAQLAAEIAADEAEAAAWVASAGCAEGRDDAPLPGCATRG
ncbi:MAG: hypothetical protein VKS61_12490 [Candidatus Sericytochromatia bacterium]|nr:hypothetical protein [Candidatus Sericytochromatia bacterium]